MIRRPALIWLGCAMLVAIPLQAQSTFGILGGISTGKMAAEVDGESITDDEKGIFSIVLGLSMRRPLNGPLSFAPEAIYVAKGFSDENSDGKVSMSYLEIPVLFRYGFETTGMIKPFLMGGPAIALQLKCTYTSEDGDDASCDDEFGSEDSYKKFDGGIVLGGGVSRERFSVTLRYDMGLLNIDKADGWSAKHRALMILVGFDL